MDLNRIEQLLTKYWDCRTTLAEEQALKEFFNAGEVPEKWQNLVPLFKYYSEEEEKRTLHKDFDEQLFAKITVESSAEPSSSGRGKMISLYYSVAKVAAVVLILITAGFFVREAYVDKQVTVDTYTADTYEDPEKAFEETKKALMLIAGNLNKGRIEAQKVAVFNEAREKIKETELGNL